MFPDKILDQKGKRSVAGIVAKNLNRVCELHGFTLSMLISQLEGFYAVYIVECFCFKEIHMEYLGVIRHHIYRLLSVVQKETAVSGEMQ